MVPGNGVQAPSNSLSFSDHPVGQVPGYWLSLPHSILPPHTHFHLPGPWIPQLRLLWSRGIWRSTGERSCHWGFFVPVHPVSQAQPFVSEVTGFQQEALLSCWVDPEIRDISSSEQMKQKINKCLSRDVAKSSLESKYSSDFSRKGLLYSGRQGMTLPDHLLTFVHVEASIRKRTAKNSSKRD